MSGVPAIPWVLIAARAGEAMDDEQRPRRRASFRVRDLPAAQQRAHRQRAILRARERSLTGYEGASRRRARGDPLEWLMGAPVGR